MEIVQIPSKTYKLNNDVTLITKEVGEPIEAEGRSLILQNTLANYPLKIFELDGYTEHDKVLTPTQSYPIKHVYGNLTINVGNGVDTQSVTINISNSYRLLKIGNSKNYIYKVNDDWYYHKEIEYTSLKSSSFSTMEKACLFSTSMTKYKKDGGICLCDRYSAVQNTSDFSKVSNYTCFFDDRNSVNKFYICDNRFSTLNDFTNFINSIGGTIYLCYIKNGYTDTKITSSSLVNSLNALENFVSYNNQTQISQSVSSSSYVTPNLKVKYYSEDAIDKEIKIYDTIDGYVDNKEAMKQAIYHMLRTERYDYIIYSDNYGVELRQYIGESFSYLKNTIERTLKDALTYDLRIKDVAVTEVTQSDKDKALVKFIAYTIYGDLQLEVNVVV